MGSPSTELWIERVLVCADQVPPGRVVAYGQVGEIVGRGPRWVGNVMARHGSDVAWWRITNASGDVPKGLRQKAFARWADEGITVKPNGLGCRIADFRADLERLAADYERAIAQVLADAGLALPTMSQPAHRALAQAGVRALEDVTTWTRADLAALHGMGPKALRELDEALERAGLAYRS
ncbi:MGMT family protein [Mariniluteicoccus flavus]